MTKFTFDDFARVAFDTARKDDGFGLTAQQMDEVFAFLKAPGSGPDADTSFADYVAAKLKEHPPVLISKAYVMCAGIDRRGVTNYQNAAAYIRDAGGSSGIINDTQWGYFIEHLQSAEPLYGEFKAMTAALKEFMHAQGTRPFNNKYEATLLEIMWNAGSPSFAENAIASHAGGMNEDSSDRLPS